MLQIAFIMLLVGVLAAVVVSFVIMGLMQLGRTRTLGREAHALGMRFSAADPFDVPRRYADFALVSSGHSPRANNVTYGRLADWRLRAFDFRYEVGHGTRRATRHYSVIVVEADRELPAVLMWHDQDIEAAPLQARNSDAHVGSWTYRGNPELAAMLTNACIDFVEEGTSLEACDSALMVFTPVRRREAGYADRLTKTIRAIEVIENGPEQW